MLFDLLSANNEKPFVSQQEQINLLLAFLRAAGSRTQPKCSQSTCTTDILQPAFKNTKRTRSLLLAFKCSLNKGTCTTDILQPAFKNTKRTRSLLLAFKCSLNKGTCTTDILQPAFAKFTL